MTIGIHFMKEFTENNVRSLPRSGEVRLIPEEAAADPTGPTKTQTNCKWTDAIYTGKPLQITGQAACAKPQAPTTIFNGTQGKRGCQHGQMSGVREDKCLTADK